MKRTTLLILFILFLFGCSDKRSYFVPKKIDRNLALKLDLKNSVEDINRYALSFLDGSVVTSKRGMLSYKIPKNFHAIYDAKNALLITDKSGDVEIVQNAKSIFSKKFDTTVASGSIKGSLLALLLSNNRVILYDTRVNKAIFDEALEPTFAQDARIANPIFVKDMVIFPTLDGRLIVYSLSSHIIVKDMVLSNHDLFNNIIFLEEHRGDIVAATRYKIVSITPSSLVKKSVDLKDIAYDGRNIYAFLNDGSIVKYDIFLKQKRKVKYDFAIFSAVSLYDRVYALLKSGYLLILDKDLNQISIDKLPVGVDKPAFFFRNKLFIGRYFFDIK